MPNKETRMGAHFVGIGGIGVSALARWFLAKGWAVSGSDVAPSGITQELQKEGVKVKIGHKKGNLPRELNMVVYSNAALMDNSELTEAKRRGLRPLSYPQALGCLTSVYRTVSVAGSHGKSTSTALLSLILKEALFDPTVVVGAKLKEFQGKNFRLGKSKWLVLEADEYKEAFTHYSSEAVLVTNIDAEHLDHYKNLAGVQKGFLKFLGKVRPGGVIVLNRESPPLFRLRKKIEEYATKKNIKIFWYDLKKKEIALIQKNLKLKGVHNLSNALGVYTLAVQGLGIPPKSVLKVFRTYGGAWRRMEHKGQFKLKESKVVVYDDYAHHPTEIKATLEAFQQASPKAKLVCVYEPHQAKRLQALYKEFIGSFGKADLLILLPIYGVAGRDKIDPRYTSESLSRDIKKKYPRLKVAYFPQTKNIRASLQKTIKEQLTPLPSSIVLVMMGAGNIFLKTKELLKK